MRTRIFYSILFNMKTILNNGAEKMKTKIELLKEEEVKEGFPLFLTPNVLEEIVYRDVIEVERNNERNRLFKATI